MNLLSLENVSRSYGEKVLFDKINLLVNQGDKIAIVARNGSGKSSLLRVIAGVDAMEGENAKLWITKDLKTSYLPQEPDFAPHQNILEALLEGDEAHIAPLKALHDAQRNNDAKKIEEALSIMDENKAWELEAFIKELLGKFNLPDYDFQVSALSGGQKKRLSIAKVLCGKPDFVILDEPTNHLDLDMIEWLEKYLESPQLTLLMVTHDRYFLNRVCNQILELDKGVLYKYMGDYEDFLEKKAMRMQNEEIDRDKTEKLLRKELEWVRRMPKARTTKAKSRVDNFYNLKESLQGPKDPGEIEFDIDHTRLGTKILELHHVCKSFGDKKILDAFSYKFKAGDRIGIIGRNGVGKTSLIKLFTGQLKTDQGKIIIGETVLFGHYEQDGLQITEDKRVIDVIRDIADYIPLKKGHKLSAETLLERFLFTRAHQQVYVSQLSGGERRRLFLLTILIKNPNFLILDEPTNDLDLITLNVLEEFLMHFPGVIVIVSHDRYFMDKLVNHVFVMEGDGIIKDYPGNYSEYRDYIKQNPVKKTTEISEKNTAIEKPKSTNKLGYKEKREMDKLEQNIAKLNQERDTLVEKFADTNLSNDQITTINKRLGEIQKIVEESELKWMEYAEQS